MPGPYVVGDNVTFDVTDIRLRRIAGDYNFTATLEFFKQNQNQPYTTLKVQSGNYPGNLSSEAKDAIDDAVVASLTWLAERF